MSALKAKSSAENAGRRIAPAAVLAWVLPLAVLVLGVWPLLAREADQAAKSDDLIALEKRIAVTAQEGLRAAEAMYESRKLEIDAVLVWSDRALKAQLRTLEKPAQRLAVIEAQIDIAEQLVSVARARHAVGQAPVTDVVAAQLMLLETQRLLVIERANGR